MRTDISMNIAFIEQTVVCNCESGRLFAGDFHVKVDATPDLGTAVTTRIKTTILDLSRLQTEFLAAAFEEAVVST